MTPRRRERTRHPLHWLLRLSASEGERQAILGDLDEEYRLRVRPTRSWPAAQAWYVGQLIAAAWLLTRQQPAVGIGAGPSRRRLPGMGDVRYALRRWRRRPGFPLAASLTLALGIGAATAMFSVVDAVLLRPLPWPNADRLAVIHMVYPERRNDPRFATTWNRARVHYPAWEALRRGSSFEDVAVWRPPSLSMTADVARTEIVEVMDVSSNFLPMLGVGLVRGRHFTAEDDERDTYNLILSYEAWQRRFGGREDVVGQPSPIAYASDTRTPPWTIVGILEPGFSFEGSRPEVFRVIGGNASSNRTFFSGDFSALGRLAPGVSVEAASAEASGLIQASQPKVPLGGRIARLEDEQLGASVRPLWLLFGAASVLLLVACANVAGLLLGENRARRHETAIRLALGITRGGIIRQLIVEHALLAFAGAATGLLLAAWLTQTLVALAPADLPRLDTVRIDWRIATFALVAGGVTLVAFGVAPSFALARTRAAGMLADGGREAAPARHVAQRTVVAAEIAMAAVLVVGAGLLGETMFRLLSQPLGFDPSNLVIVSTRFTGSDVPADLRNRRRGDALPEGPTLADRMAAARLGRTHALVERLSVLPGVVHAAAVAAPPFSTRPSSSSFNATGLQTSIRVGGRAVDADDRAGGQTVTARFTETLRVPVLEGRGFAPTDGPDAALVSHEFARQYFDGAALGRRFESVVGSRRSTYEVIGIVADLKRHTLAEAPNPTYYALGSGSVFALRTAGDPGAVLPSVRAAIAEVDPHVVVTGTTTMEASLASVIAAERFRATLSTAFAVAALVLSAVGLYGVAARRVGDRRRELGIRVALGARPSALGGLVMRETAVTVAVGLAVGLPVALSASQAARSFLFGVSPTTPHVFAGASVVLAAAAFVATLLPARRASRVDPMVALKE